MAATDDFGNYTKGLDSPAAKAVAITPHDTNELAKVTRALYVGAAGDAVVQFGDDTATVTLVGLLTGVVYPFRLRLVKAAGTSAASMVGLY